MTDLKVVLRPLSTSEVPGALERPGGLKTESLGCSADLTPMLDRVQEDLESAPGLGTKTDPTYAELLHTALRDLPRRVLLDPRLWQWLSLGPFSTYTLARWCDIEGPEEAQSLPKSQRVRFVGSASLSGIARSSTGRLFWGAEAAWRTDGDYERVKKVFSSADVFVGIFERRLGLDPERAMALLGVVLKIRGKKAEERRRTVLREVNMVLSTTSLEALEPKDVGNLARSIAGTHGFL